MYHRSKFLQTCLDYVDAVPRRRLCGTTRRERRRWGASAPPPCGDNTSVTSRHGNIRALRGTYLARIGDPHMLLILSIMATQLRTGTGHRGFRVLPTIFPCGFASFHSAAMTVAFRFLCASSHPAIALHMLPAVAAASWKPPYPEKTVTTRRPVCLCDG